MIKNYFLTFSLCLIVMVSGCSAVSVVEPKRYVLNGVATQKIAKNTSSHVAYVSDVEAISAYNSSDMVYTTKPLLISAFAENEWATTPAKMLRTILIESLQNTAYFKGVLSSGISTSARFHVNATLLQLRQNFIKHPSEMNLAIKVDVIDTKRDKVLASRRFSEKIQAKEDSPYGGVLAANIATKKIMGKIASFVVNNSR